MSDEEKKVVEAAVAFAQENKKAIAKRLTDPNKYPSERQPVSVFMAGSPGAGKTESSQNLLKVIGEEHRILRIDTDDIRCEFPDYTGTNSSLFQGATSIVADKMQDLALSRGQSFVFDGTLSKLEIARRNVQRSIDKVRPVFIVYVYQDPLQAWEFVKKREKEDGRFVPKEAFIEQYFQARDNVNILKKEFGSQVMIYLVVKNIDGTDINYFQNIDVIDNYIPERYNIDQLKILIV